MSVTACPTRTAKGFGNSAYLPALILLVASLSGVVTSHHADRPLGQLAQQYTQAYTLDAGEVALSGTFIVVNDDLDFFDMRGDMIGPGSRLDGNSGDLDGYGAALDIGLTRYLTAFYREQHQDMTLTLAPQSRVNITEVDDALSTRRRAYGFKWNIFEAGYVDQGRPWHAASLEVTRHENRSDPYGARIQRVDVNRNAVITFDPPQRFAIDRMHDTGWQGRLIYSWPLSQALNVSTWGGYGQFRSSSGTSSEIDSEFIARAFEQRFITREKQWIAGASVNWHIHPRLPLQLSYEYIDISSRDLRIERESSSIPLPGILQPDNIRAADNNHVISGSLSYWLSPRLHVTAEGKLYRNQFTGVMPHFANPLSGSFSDVTYGYAGLRLGYYFSAVQH